MSESSAQERVRPIRKAREGTFRFVGVLGGIVWALPVFVCQAWKVPVVGIGRGCVKCYEWGQSLVMPIPPTHWGFQTMRWLGEVGHDIAGPDLKQPDTDNEHLMQYVEGVFHLPYRRRTKIKDRAPRTWKALTPEDALQTQVKWVLDTRDMGLSIVRTVKPDPNREFALASPGYSSKRAVSGPEAAWGRIGRILKTLKSVTQAEGMLRPTEEWKFLVENNGLHPEIDAGYGTWMIKKALMYTVRPPREIPWAFMRLLASDTPFDPHKSTRDKKLLELRAQLRDECMTAGTRYFIFTTQRYYLLGRFTPKFDMCHYSRPYKNSDPELFCHMIVHMHRALGVLVGMEEPDGLPAVSRKPSEIGRLFKLHREDGTDDDATIAEPYLSPPSGGWRGKGGSSDAPTGGMPTPAPSLRPSGSSREPLLGVTAPTPVPAPAPKRNSADTHLNVAAPTPARNSSPSPAPIITVSASSSSLAPVPGQAPTVARNPSPMPTTTAANPPPSSGYTPTNFLSSSNLAMHDAQNSAGRPRKTSNEPQPPTRHYPRPPTVLIDGNVQNPEERQYYPSNGQAVPSRSHKTSAHGKP